MASGEGDRGGEGGGRGAGASISFITGYVAGGRRPVPATHDDDDDKSVLERPRKTAIIAVGVPVVRGPVW